MYRIFTKNTIDLYWTIRELLPISGDIFLTLYPLANGMVIAMCSLDTNLRRWLPPWTLSTYWHWGNSRRNMSEVKIRNTLVKVATSHLYNTDLFTRSIFWISHNAFTWISQSWRQASHLWHFKNHTNSSYNCKNEKSKPRCVALYRNYLKWYHIGFQAYLEIFKNG